MAAARKRRGVLTVCSEPGCPNLTKGSFCTDHLPEPWRDVERRRPRRKGQSGWSIQKLHREIIQRYRGICHVCGKDGSDEVDHVLPLSQGGTDTADNLRPIHSKPCHAEKTLSESQKGKNRVD